VGIRVSCHHQAKRNDVRVKEKYQCTDKKYLEKQNGSRRIKKEKEIRTKNSAKPIGGKEEPLTSLSPNSIPFFLFLRSTFSSLWFVINGSPVRRHSWKHNRCDLNVSG